MQKVTAPVPVLVVDDDEAIARLVGTYLRRQGYAADWCMDADAAVAAVRRAPYALLVADYQLPGLTGLELRKRLEREQGRALPVVVMTAHGNVETAVEAIRAGAADFLTKPFELALLAVVVQRVLAHHLATEELAALRRQVGLARETHGLVGEDDAMVALRRRVERLAAADGAVLVTGETGTGKELVARALHAAGPRRAGPFVAINCAALPPALAEAELFGHVRGAFTDAREERLGVFREADGGTLLLDEVGELSPPTQAALLRVLQERRVRPVGANRETPVDVRVVTATHRDLRAAVKQGAFREDLLFRLDVLHVEVPPLRARGRDVLVLWHHFLTRAALRQGRATPAVSAAASEALLRHAWPGNVRELENAVERALLACDGERIDVWHLPDAVGQAPVAKAGDAWPLVSLAELERRHIARVLGAVGGNRVRAAALLGIDRVTLYRKLKRDGAGRSGASRHRPR